MIKRLLHIAFGMLFLPSVFAQVGDKLSITGYVRDLPLLGTDDAFTEYNFNNILHNRLNMRFDGGDNWSIRMGQRTRYLYGEAFSNPFFVEFLRSDQGPLPLSHVLHNSDQHVIHTITDRLYFDWQKGDWQVRIGRQRINWGINLVFNPNDFFNNYNFFDFDYDERPGTDAIRITHFDDVLSRWELAYSPGIEARNSVAAVMRAINYNGYDLQVMGGYFHHRAAIGGGWAGSIGGMGWKGEMSYFHDLASVAGKEPGNIVASMSGDYRFNNGLFLIGEVVYNQQRAGVGPDALVLIDPLRADNVTFSEWAVVSTVQYQYKLLHSFSLAAMYFPIEDVFFLSPNYTRSLHRDLDLSLLSQLFIGPSDAPLASAGYNLIVMIQWNFM